MSQRLSPTMLRYFGRQFALNVVWALGVLWSVIWLFETLELLRRASKRQTAGLSDVLHMSFYKLPQVGQELFPFAILFAALFTFWRLTRSQELVVARTAGLSVWQFLLPALSAAIFIGILRVALVNPAGAVLIARYEQMEQRYLEGRASLIDLSSAGLWLRQADDDSQIIINARKVYPAERRLEAVTIYMLGADDQLNGRIDAPEARLIGRTWLVDEGWLNQPGHDPAPIRRYKVETGVTLDTIEDSFSGPDTLGFWALPAFIDTLEASGFSAIRFRVHYQTLLAQPLLFAGIVLIAAAFGLRQQRRGGILLLIGGGVMTGFAIFFLSDLVTALATSETIPVAMAAWLPAGLALAGGAGALLFLEDG